MFIFGALKIDHYIVLNLNFAYRCHVTQKFVFTENFGLCFAYGQTSAASPQATLHW